MKQLRTLFMSMLAVASVGFMTSCGGDDDDPEPKPSIEFIGGTGMTSGDQTVAAGTDLTTKVTAKSSTSGRNLDKFRIQVSFDGGITTTYLDSAGLKGENFEFQHTFPTRGVPGTEKWTYTIIDRNGQSNSVSYTITTTDNNPGADINTFTTELLGSHNNSNQGFYSTTTGTRYYRNTAVNNQGLIDFLYFYGATNAATIAAPNDPAAMSITSLGLNSWTTRNATTFKTTSLNAAAFDAITSSANLSTAYDLGTNFNPASRANNLQAGQVIGFMTQGNKKGLIKIINITGTDAGTITIDVKVQK